METLRLDVPTLMETFPLRGAPLGGTGCSQGVPLVENEELEEHNMKH